MAGKTNNCICTLRHIYKAIGECEQQLVDNFELTLNEAMTICVLDQNSLCSTEIADATGMQCSQTSKVIKSLENKELISRKIGISDKRNMFFGLTTKGQTMRTQIEQFQFKIPAILQQVV